LHQFRCRLWKQRQQSVGDYNACGSCAGVGRLRDFSSLLVTATLAAAGSIGVGSGVNGRLVTAMVSAAVVLAEAFALVV
jgi:hypothetical protein